MKSTKESFCYFSGYTEIYQLQNRVKSSKDQTIKFSFALKNHSKQKFAEQDYVQLNGVLCQVVSRTQAYLTLQTLESLTRLTNLRNAKIGAYLAISFAAENVIESQRGYLLHPSTSGTATIAKIEVAKGHTKTLRIDLMMKTKTEIEIENELYIGVNGSSMEPKDVSQQCISHHHSYQQTNSKFFSLLAGKQTQENSMLNKHHAIGGIVNINYPKI